MGADYIDLGDHHLCERSVKDLAFGEGTLLQLQGAQLTPDAITISLEPSEPCPDDFTRAGPCCYKCGDCFSHDNCQGSETPLWKRIPHVDPTGEGAQYGCKVCKE